MKFITNIDKEKYDSFVSSNPKGHFLQSYVWGEFAKLEKNLIPHYVGVVDDNDNLMASALLLEKKLPLKKSYFYIPRGPVLDYKNKELLEFLVNNLKDYTKKNKGIFIKIDPDLVINCEDYLGEKKDTLFNSDSVKMFKELGFKHLGFTKNFETMQPRYSFRIDNKQSFDDVVEHFSKTTKQRIKKAESIGAEVKIGNYDDLEDFYKLMILTENRKDFVTHNLKYYQTLYKLSQDDKNCKCNLFVGSINLGSVINGYTDRFNSLNNEKKELESKEERSKKENSRLNEVIRELEKTESDLNKYKDYQTQYGDNIVLSGHFIISYGNKAWVLYAGNHNVLSETYVNYKTYLEHIKYYHDKVEIYDQFGTIGDLSEDNHLLGLHEFKKKFGGDYVEFIGEFDLVLNKFFYFVFTKLVPIYRNIIKKLAKNKRHKES